MEVTAFSRRVAASFNNGEVDFIRVLENVSGDTHLIVLQVPLGNNEFQDVATIEVEKTGAKSYNFQMRGNELIYGPDYYFVPAVATIATWSVIRWNEIFMQEFQGQSKRIEKLKFDRMPFSAINLVG